MSSSTVFFLVEKPHQHPCPDPFCFLLSIHDYGHAPRGGLSPALCERRRARQAGHGHRGSFYHSLSPTLWLLLDLLSNLDRTTKKSSGESLAD